MDLNKKFNIDPDDGKKNLQVTSTIDSEFEYTRNNIIENIELAQEALRDLFELARSSQHPRSYEVLTSLLKTTNEMNKDLAEIRSKKKDLERTPAEQAPQTVNNNLIMTTQQLQQMIADMSQKGSD